MLTIETIFASVAALMFWSAAPPVEPIPDSTTAAIAKAGYTILPYQEGDQCIVCGMPLKSGDMELAVRGRRVPVDQLHAMDFLKHEEEYFKGMQPRSALFQEAFEAPPGTAQGGITFGWFAVGMVILTSLLFAGMSAYLAVARGFSPVRWFFVGLILNIFGFLYVLSWPPRAGSENVPRGLVKVPRTSMPAICPNCGHMNHPSARECTSCHTALIPSAESEVSRAT